MHLNDDVVDDVDDFEVVDRGVTGATADEKFLISLAGEWFLLNELVPALYDG